MWCSIKNITTSECVILTKSSIKAVIVVAKLASLLMAVASSDNVSNNAGDESTKFEICWWTQVYEAILAPVNWNRVKNVDILMLYWFELQIKLK